MIVYLILVLAPTALGQYYGMSYGMKADLSFNEDNDRFDIENIVKEQERVFPQPKQHHDEDYRRHTYRRDDSPSSSEEDAKNLFQSPASELKEPPVKKQFVPVLDMQPGTILETGDFAYHDNMESGYETDYEKHLIPFQRSSRRNILYELLNRLHGGKLSRRSMDGVDPEAELLFHHAVPVKVSIDGFVKLPRNLV